jgi:hypothetical protein
MTVREKGVLKFLCFGAISSAAVFGIYWINLRAGQTPHGGLLIVLAAPGAYAMIGIVEAFSGRPLREFGSMWDSLKGWQRGVLGIAVAACAFAVFMGIVVIFFG